MEKRYCKWEKTDRATGYYRDLYKPQGEFHRKYKTDCGHETTMSKGTHCPHCKRRIKVATNTKNK